MAEEVKKDEPKKKGPLGKLKEAVDDKEEQLLILSTFVRLGCSPWRDDMGRGDLNFELR